MQLSVLLLFFNIVTPLQLQCISSSDVSVFLCHHGNPFLEVLQNGCLM